MIDQLTITQPRLIIPSLELRAQFLEMLTEYRAASEAGYQWFAERFGDDVRSYLTFLDEQSRGVNLPADHVRTTTYWMLGPDGRLLGATRIRHELNDRLREWGGNIGYDIRPGERRKGYGTRILALALAEARRLGMRRVMLTCDASNVGSIGVIRNNGGRFDAEYFLQRVGVSVRRYWIDAPQETGKQA